MLIIGITWLSTVFNFLNKAIKTNATIIDHVERGRDSTTLAPVFLFETKNGTSIKIDSNIGSSIREFTVGDTIEIYYDPNHPYDAKINSFVQLWAFPIIICLFGISFVIVVPLIYKKFRAEWDNENI